MPGEAESAVKTVRIGSITTQIEGPSVDDRYFQAIGDHFEPEFERLCQDLIKEDYVCVDLGANIGVKSLMLAQAANRGKVLSVEAAPKVFSILERNIRRSGLKNIIYTQAAVTDKNEKVFFKDASAYGHIATSGVEVRAATLETLLQEAGLRKPDFVKIDVEGNEFPVLRNSLRLFNESRSLILFELNLWCQMVMGKTNPADFIGWLSQNFSEVHVLHSHPERGYLLEKVHAEQCLEILRSALLNGKVVSDLVVTNAPERLWPQPQELRAKVIQLTHERDCAIAERDRAIAEKRQIIAERDQVLAERDRVAAERDCAIAGKNQVASERDEILKSKSWRATAPVRSFMAALRRH